MNDEQGYTFEQLNKMFRAAGYEVKRRKLGWLRINRSSGAYIEISYREGPYKNDALVMVYAAREWLMRNDFPSNRGMLAHEKNRATRYGSPFHGWRWIRVPLRYFLGINGYLAWEDTMKAMWERAGQLESLREKKREMDRVIAWFNQRLKDLSLNSIWSDQLKSDIDELDKGDQLKVAREKLEDLLLRYIVEVYRPFMDANPDLEGIR